jgi:hypothetical protein
VAPYFFVVSDANLEEFLGKIKRQNNGVFIAITPEDYELLAQNFQEIKRYIKQCREVNSYYEGLLGAGQSEKEESK